MARLTERDEAIITKAYQGKLVEAIAREMNISIHCVGQGTFRRLGTSAKDIRAAAREGVTIESLIAKIKGNGDDSAPPLPVSDIQSLTLSALASIERRLASIECKLEGK